ncbi:hypothetical protein TUM4438_16420 [Shewanella sairae]|uniref:Sulfur carrier protein ThiS n=1 Tax=Shewanella sairae TaxID=190310 RepID=A0ABQ4PAT3_9GAMM|nr:sulfur carrier protein ThiS [Shewanella sairae]MCL1130181.1 sulfur carrier protein ThiS [Shewanella sairae]GIU44675.1 hypothetical protein TUM4438_16420 [Shewanella sairae]
MYKGKDFIAVSINDESKLIAADSTVQSVLERYTELRGVDISAIAVAINSEVLPRARWQAEPCLTGDKFEIFSVVAGG